MQNSESDPLSLPFASRDAVTVENKLWVAATVAAVVLAGSAIAYRCTATNPGSRRRLFWNDSHAFEAKMENEKHAEGPVGPDRKGLSTALTSATTYATGQELEDNTGTTKSSRSKDRRKRGKDPLKEVLKSGKKLKFFPTPAGSSSTPSSPKPPAATLNSSLTGKGEHIGENPESYSSFEPGSSLAALQTQIADLQQALPEFQRSPAKRRQREESDAVHATPSIHLSTTGHSRDISDVSQISRFPHDAENDLAGDEDPDFEGTSNYRRYPHPHIPHSQSSCSPPRSQSSLSEVEDGGWVTSISKSPSKQRASLAVIFDDAHIRVGGYGHDGLDNRTEDEGVPTNGGNTRDYMDQGLEATENTTSMVEAEETSMFPQPNAITFLSTSSHVHTSSPDTSTDTVDAHRLNTPASTSLLSPNLSPEKNKSKARRAPVQGQQGYQQESRRDGSAIPSQSTTSSAINLGTRDTRNNEDENTKQDHIQSKGNSKTSHPSSAVTGGRQTVSVSAAVASQVSTSGSASASMGTGTGETEISFPTLNPHASTTSIGSSTRARSTLFAPSGNSSSPSKKNKRFSSNKSSTPPPNASPSRTSSPSNIRENYAAQVQGPNAGVGSSNTPALSTQTQLASLRGALEAARLREEKHRAEMERVMKEMETLKWESTNSRRREVELQAQVRQRTHQLQSYAALFASVAPQLNPHFAMHLPVVQLHPQANANALPHLNENPHSDVNPSDPSSPKVDPIDEMPDGSMSSKTPELDKLEAQAAEEEPAPSLDKAQGHHVPDTPTSPQTEQPSLSPPPSAVPAFFPYTIPPYLATQHSHFPVHHSPWMYHHYQAQQTQNMSGSASGSSPSQQFPNVYSPMMYPVSPVASPLSPKSVGMMPHQLLHQHQPFGFSGAGLRSTGASSAGSHSPELIGPPFGLSKQKPRMRRRKSQLVNLNGNARTGWEDVGDGWIGLSKVVMQPTIDKGRRAADEGGMADGEGEDDEVESASSPYSELLADAILKRSSTIRPSKKNGQKENGQEGVEGVEPFTEFTFPSLSDFTNVYSRTASRTESSISSSLSSSPPSTTATVPDVIGDAKWEEDNPASLPPLIEKAKDSEPSLPDAVVVQGEAGPDGALSKIQDPVGTEQATPKNLEENERSLMDEQ